VSGRQSQARIVIGDVFGTEQVVMSRSLLLRKGSKVRSLWGAPWRRTSMETWSVSRVRRISQQDCKVTPVLGISCILLEYHLTGSDHNQVNSVGDARRMSK